MAGTWSVQVNDLQVGKFLRNSGQRLKSKGGGGVLLGVHRGVDTAYSLFGIKADRLQNAGYQTRKPFRSSSDFRPEAFAASFQTKRIQNISKLSPARIYYVLRIIFGFSLPERSFVVQDTP